MDRETAWRRVRPAMLPGLVAAVAIGTVLAVGSDCNGRLASASAAGSAAAAVAGSAESPFVRVADAVIPTVVYISAERHVSAGSSMQPEGMGPLDEFFRRFFPDMPPMPFGQQQEALGSGVIIDPRGYVVTNNHVVAGSDRISVRLSDSTEFTGDKVKLVGRDPKTDLAVLKVDAGRSLPTIAFGRSDSVRVGDWAIAVGNAFGLQSTVTVGVVSAKGRAGLPLPEGPSYQDFIQTDASINPGNSGGALVNIRGELIGINTAIRSTTGSSAGVGFAVPVDMVRDVTSQLIERGKVVRGFLGIRPQPVTDAIRKAKGLGSVRGVLVSEVVRGNPAEKAGIQAGDVIVKVNGEGIRDVEQFRRKVAEHAPGSEVVIELVRDRKNVTKRVRLTEMPDDQQAARPQDDTSTGRFGLVVRELTEAERRNASTAGAIVVESVERGSPAAVAGLQRGDVILEVGEKEVADMADYRRAIEQAKPGSALLLRIERSGNKLYVAIEPSQ